MLETINFPDSLKNIDGFAFTTCHNLQAIDLNNVESIGEYSFLLCIYLEEITVPKNIKTVPKGAFQGCGYVETLTFEEGVVEIQSEAGLNMYSINKIVIPRSVTAIGEHALGYSYWYPDYKKLDNVTIYGYKGTIAETYATENGFVFIALD